MLSLSVYEVGGSPKTALTLDTDGRVPGPPDLARSDTNCKLGVPETTLRFSDLPGGFTEYAWLWFTTAKGCSLKSAQGRDRDKVRHSRCGAASCPALVEQGRCSFPSRSGDSMPTQGAYLHLGVQGLCAVLSCGRSHPNSWPVSSPLIPKLTQSPHLTSCC